MNANRILSLVLIGIVWVAPAIAEEKPGQWYLTPAATGTWVGSDRPVSDDPGIALGFGRAVNEKINLEFMFQASDHDGALGQASQDIRDFSFNLLRVFYREDRISPYFLIGVDWIDVSSADPVWNVSDKGLSLGVGLLSDLTRNGGVALRSEVRMRTQFHDNFTVNDVVATLGLQFPLGSPYAPPPAPAPSDSDGDGVIDSQDRCPGTPAGRVVNSQGCELDADGDGVVDGVDQCPNTPAGAPVDAVGCPLDSDGDGVPDYKDRCPDTPAGDRVDVNGCTLQSVITLRGVNFELNSADLTTQSSDVLDEAAATLNKHPDLDVEVAGYTDSTGEASYNEGLSQRRAESVMNYLTGRSVTSDRLSAKGYGESNPVASNETNEGRAENRRVTLRILNQ